VVEMIDNTIINHLGMVHAWIEQLGKHISSESLAFFEKGDSWPIEMDSIITEHRGKLPFDIGIAKIVTVENEYL
jgi:hypothetical protein